MEWVGLAATWLRDFLVLDTVRSAISQTPDWVLLLTGPVVALLLVFWTTLMTPRGKRVAENSETETSSKVQASSTAATASISYAIVADGRGPFPR